MTTNVWTLNIHFILWHLLVVMPRPLFSSSGIISINSQHHLLHISYDAHCLFVAFGIRTISYLYLSYEKHVYESLSYNHTRIPNAGIHLNTCSNKKKTKNCIGKNNRRKWAKKVQTNINYESVEPMGQWLPKTD